MQKLFFAPSLILENLEKSNPALTRVKQFNKEIILGILNMVKIKRHTETAITPIRANATDSGLDLFADEEVSIIPGGRALVSTGISLEMPAQFTAPDGSTWVYEAQLRPRSGNAVKLGMSVHFGTIDNEYRGIVKVLVYNFSDRQIKVEPGMRIAQLVITPVALFNPIEVGNKELSITGRGTKGFGSSGTFTSEFFSD